MQRQYRLSQNRQFSYVYRRGTRASCKDISILHVKNQQKRVGFSVSKKVGVAVVRNRTKRRLRECFRQRMNDMKSGLYVVVARPSAAERSYAELSHSVDQLLRKMNLYGQRPKEDPRPKEDAPRS